MSTEAFHYEPFQLDLPTALAFTMRIVHTARLTI
jgi:hypothetical protein